LNGLEARFFLLKDQTTSECDRSLPYSLVLMHLKGMLMHTAAIAY
jgi:hypothetical protein